MLRVWALMCVEILKAAVFNYSAASRLREVPHVLSVMSGIVVFMLKVPMNEGV